MRSLTCQIKSVACLCYGASITLSIMLSMRYSELSNRALEFNELEQPVIVVAEGDLPVVTSDVRPYDACGGVSDELDYSTNWTRVYKFNAVLYAMVASFFLCTTSMIPFAYNEVSIMAMGCCSFCIGCAAFPTFAAIIVTAVRLFNSSGDLCATNPDVYMTRTIEDGTLE